jgi:hypothetical protein
VYLTSVAGVNSVGGSGVLVRVRSLEFGDEQKKEQGVRSI